MFPEEAETKRSKNKLEDTVCQADSNKKSDRKLMIGDKNDPTRTMESIQTSQPKHW